MLKKSNHFQTPPSKSILKATLDIWGQTGRQHLIPISGRSMLPLIQDGDSVLVKHGDMNIKRGDVIVFMQENRMVVHRVLRIDHDDDETVYIAKGDNNPYLDPQVSADQIVGRVFKIKRGSRYMSIDTATWHLLGWLITIGMLVWVKFYDWGRSVKTKLWNDQNHRLSQFLRWGFLMISEFPLKIIQKLTNGLIK